MKHIILLILTIVSYIGIGISMVWAIVEFILYLVKDKEFNWWSVWLTIIFIVTAITSAILLMAIKEEYKLPKPNRDGKSKFAERLEKMEKQRNERKQI